MIAFKDVDPRLAEYLERQNYQPEDVEILEHDSAEGYFSFKHDSPTNIIVETRVDVQLCTKGVALKERSIGNLKGSGLGLIHSCSLMFEEDSHFEIYAHKMEDPKDRRDADSIRFSLRKLTSDDITNGISALYFSNVDGQRETLIGHVKLPPIELGFRSFLDTENRRSLNLGTISRNPATPIQVGLPFPDNNGNICFLENEDPYQFVCCVPKYVTKVSLAFERYANVYEWFDKMTASGRGWMMLDEEIPFSFSISREIPQQNQADKSPEQ